jgi:hypothetical protein
MIIIIKKYSIVLTFLFLFIETFNVSYAPDKGAYLLPSDGLGIPELFNPQLQELILLIIHIFFYLFLCNHVGSNSWK